MHVILAAVILATVILATVILAALNSSGFQVVLSDRDGIEPDLKEPWQVSIL